MPALGRAEGGDSGLAEGAGDRLGLGSGTTATRSLGSACGPAVTPTRSGPGRRRGDIARRAPALPGRPQPQAPGSPQRPRPRLLLPSLAFFLRASVPPSFPKNESSFLRDGGDLGVGDLGTEGDFCGDVAMAAGRGAGARRPRRAAAGLRLRLSKRKRNYSRHLRQLARLSRPSLPPSRRPPPCEELLRLGPPRPGLPRL